MFRPNIKQPLSLAEKSGFAIIAFSVLVFTIAPVLTVLALLFYLLLCLSAPFLPQFSFFLPIISRGKEAVTAVAITFDDGPSPSSTPDLLQLLDKYHFKATFFVIGQKAQSHPELIYDILAKGHSIANHSYSHDNLLMFKRYHELKKDIQTTQSILQGFGVQPHLYRPPVGITNPKLKTVLAEIGLITVTFSCRAFDRGNKNVAGLADKVIARLQPGNILMLHDTCPRQSDRKQSWLAELDRVFIHMQKVHTVLPLEEVIQQPVMSVKANPCQ